MNDNSTASRLNRAKNQYENILLGLHLPVENDESGEEGGGLSYDFSKTTRSNNNQILSAAVGATAGGDHHQNHLPTYSSMIEGFVGEADVEDIIVNQQAEIDQLRHDLAELRLRYEADIMDARRRQASAERSNEEVVAQYDSETSVLRTENHQLKAALTKSTAEVESYKQQLNDALLRIIRLSHSSSSLKPH